MPDIFDEVSKGSSSSDSASKSGGDIFDEVSSASAKVKAAGETPGARNTISDLERSRFSQMPAEPQTALPSSRITSQFTPRPQRSAADTALEQVQGPDLALAPKVTPTAPARDRATQMEQQTRQATGGMKLVPQERAPLAQPQAPPTNLEDQSLLNALGITRSEGQKQRDTQAEVAESLSGLSPQKAAEIQTLVQRAMQYNPRYSAPQVAQIFRSAYDRGGDEALKSLSLAQSGLESEKTIANRPLVNTGSETLDSLTSPAGLALMAPTGIGLGETLVNRGVLAASAATAKAGVGYLAGVYAGKGAAEAARLAGASPEVQEYANAAAFFLPSTVARMAGAESRSVSGNGSAVEAGGAFGGKVRGAVGYTPSEFGGEVSIGDKTFSVRVPRGQAPEAPPEPSRIAAQQQMQDTAATIARANATNAAASNMAAGVPPPQPPKPPAPAGMDEGTLTPQTVSNVADAIRTAPEADRPQMMMEAHQQLTEWIQKQGKFVGPDGKIQMAQTPEQASKIAQTIINDEIDRHDKVAQEQQKAAETAQQDALKKQADAAKAAQSGEGEPDLVQRARAIIESLPEGKSPTSALQRSLKIGYGEASRLIEQVQNSQHEVGGKGDKTIEESRATVDAQLEALKRGDINVVMLPEGSRYTPKVPEGMKMMGVQGDHPGSGMYIYNPTKVRAATIREAAKAGTHGDLLGHIQSKEEIAGKPTVVVQARTADGTPIQDSEVEARPEMIAAQTEALQERHPEATIEVRPVDEVLRDRAAAHEAPAATGDIFDQVSAGGQETKYKFGNTQASIDKGSEAHKALEAARNRVADEDLAGDGKDIGENHVTVRYGIKGDDTKQIEAYLRKQAPFEASLGKTEKFEPTENSDGAAVIQAPVEAPELHRMNAEIEKHGDFKEPDFDYKPHATVAYVKPEAAEKYVGMEETAGKKFTVDRIAISDRNGDVREIPLEGKRAAGAEPKSELQATMEKHGVDARTAEGMIRKGLGEKPEKAPEAVPGEKASESPERAAASSSGAAASNEVEKEEVPAKRLDGIDGRETELITPSGTMKARYRLVEANSLITSHKAGNFAVHPDYPAGVQERNYDTNKELQAGVINQVKNFRPEYVINTNPDAVNGPPIITPNGVVLGGNSRAMTIRRAYDRIGSGTASDAYRRLLLSSAKEYGLKESTVEALNRPVLVREIEAPEGQKALRKLGSELNKSATRALSATERAVSAGKNISEDTMDRLAEMLQEASGEEPATLRKVMGEPKYAREIVRMLVADGAITTQERGGYTESRDGTLNDAGKQFVESAVLGALVDDPKVMEAVPPAILNKLSSSLGPISALATRDDHWNILPVLRGALAEHGEIAKRNTSVDLYLGNLDMFAPERNQLVDAAVRTLAEGTRDVRKAFREFAQDAAHDVPGQIRLLGDAPEPADAFNHAFGTSVSPEQYATALKESESHIVKREVKRFRKRSEPRPSPAVPAAAETESSIAETATPAEETKLAEPKWKKGDAVRFYDRNNIEHSGTIQFADERIARIKADTGEFKVKQSDIIGAAEAGKAEETLASYLGDVIRYGDVPKDNKALRELVSDFDGKAADNARLKQAQEALEEALVGRAREIVSKGTNPKEVYARLVDLYASQPNLNVRTSTSMQNQAYSTPAPLAYLADQLAGVTKDSTVYEPTAGNGMLLIAASPENATANELDPQRAEALRRQGYNVIEGDALDAGVGAKSFDAVVTNPPFGSVKEAGKATKVKVDGFALGKIDHLIAARALDAMKDDGRATLILGADKVAGQQSTDDRIFFNWLYSHYNVSGHFEVDGSLYNRQGANWPVRVISIDGRAASDKVAPMPGSIERARTWEEVYEQSMGTRRGRAIESGAGSTAVGEPGRGNEPAEIQKPAGSAPVAAAGAESGTVPTAVGIERGSGTRAVRGRVDVSGVPDRPGADDVRPDADVAESDRLAKGEPRPSRRPAGDAQPRGSAGGDSLVASDNQHQVVYTPASSKKDVGVLIPRNMRDPMVQAMLRLEDEVGDIDAYVASQLGYDSIDDMHEAFMGLQVDSLAAAIHQIQRGKAIIIGDQTGIGKGRQAAGVLRWALRNNKIPVFVTVKDQLFSDMYGDLEDIGVHDLNPFLVNADASITLRSGEKAFRNNLSRHRKRIEEVARTGELPPGTNAVFLTYSQINVENKQRELLRKIANNAVIVLDESHNAGGASNTGEFVQALLNEVSGATYLSATYAKRPDNMQVYFKTDIGLAVGDSADLEEAMKQGGLPLQTVVSNNLVKAGQFFRRERSYDGVQMLNHIETRQRSQHVAIADSATAALRAIVEADRRFHDFFVEMTSKQLRQEFGSTASGGGNKASAMVQHTEFSSVVHNFVRQMLLGLNTEVAVEHALAALKADEKPLIALENTMGSFLSEFASARGLRPGDSLKGLDYRSVLERALERTRVIMVHPPSGGDPVRKEIGMFELDGETRALYEKALDIIQSSKIDLPISPLDQIRHGLTQAGHSVAEITGRDLAVDYSGAVPKLTTIPAEEKGDKVRTTRRFNNGELDALILNVAGSTGISLHASSRFKDQRQRHMLVAQAAQDINIFMQMLGRTHRTGQVVLPKYTLINPDLPATRRPTAVLSKKMKSLNANTSSNTESATSVKASDILNKYGDEIVASYLRDNPILAARLGLTPSDSSNPDLAKQATGRLAILPVKEQEAFYADVEQAYEDHIAYLDATNQNDLEPRTFDFDAEPVKEDTFLEATDPSTPFGEEAVYGEYSIKLQGKPVSPADVREAMKDALGDKTPAQHLIELRTSLDRELANYSRTLTEGELGRVQEAAAKARRILQENPIGTTMRISVNGEEYTAVVTDIRNSHKGTGNPYALSKFSVRLATNGSLRNISVPMTELERIKQGPAFYQLDDAFRDRGLTRERVKIITGNLLAAYGEMRNTEGKIISFTKKDGTIEQGILLPKKFDLKTNTRGDVRMADPAMIVSMLKTSTSEAAKNHGIGARDLNVFIKRSKIGGLEIEAPKSKARGGRYFLDPEIIKVVGDFVSSGSFMKASIPAGKEIAAIEAVMRKTALYAPPSMANEARAAVQKKQDASSSPTLRASLFGVDILAQFMAKQGKKLFENDLAPFFRSAGETGMQAGKQVANLLYPRIGANEDALDALMIAKGKREQHRFMLENLMGGLEKFFDKMTRDEQVAFIDRYKLGQGQIDPYMQQIEAAMRAIDDASIQEAQKYNPNLTAKEDHYRVIWKVIPGSKQAANGNPSRVGSGRKPFEGDKGFMKRATLETISEGLNMGGVPVTYNPWKMFSMAQGSMMQYITAQRYWASLKSLGLRKFVKLGDRAPEGWTQIDDRIANVYFPAASGEGLVNAGKWYVEPSAGRNLANFLSRDLIRDNAVGNTMMKVKNLATGIELSLSPFHFIFETLEAMGSQFGLGVQRAWNNGVRMGMGAEMTQGLKEMATAVAAPVMLARQGGNLLKATRDLQAFAATKRGQEFLKRFPDAGRLLDDLFSGGLTWGMQEDFRFDPIKSMREAARDGNYAGTVLRAVPWLNEIIMRPLFAHYIPRLKAGFALAQYAQQLVQQADALQAGETTRAKIARQVIDTSENRFGEMNFDNLFWNRTFKTTMQYFFRSVTWLLGNWRGAATATTREAAEAFRDPLKAMYEDVRAGKKQRPAGYYLPKLGMNQAWLLGMTALSVVLGTILAKLWTSKYPWEYAEADEREGYSKAGALLLETIHPRTGRFNARTGKPERVSLPTGMKSFEHGFRHPREYLRSSMSDTAGKFVDLAENRDFFNNYVYDPNAPIYKQAAEMFAYAVPKPISLSNWQDEYGSPDISTKVLKSVGLAPTSRELDLSPAEEKAMEINRSHHTPTTPEERRAKQELEAVHKSTPAELRKALRSADKSYMEETVNRMTYEDAKRVYNEASPLERGKLRPILEKKRMNLLRRGEGERVRYTDAAQE